MNPVDAFEKYVAGWEALGGMIRRPWALAPLAILAALEWGLLAVLRFFDQSALSTVSVPLVAGLGGEIALHYPMHFVLLPGMYQRVYAPLVATLGFVLFQWSVRRMRTHMGARPTGSAWGAAIKAIAVGVLLVAGITLVHVVVDAAAGSRTGMVARGIDAVGLAGVMTVQLLLAYALFHVTAGNGLVESLRRGVSTLRRRFLATLFVVATIHALHAPVDFLVGRPDRVVVKFTPEIIFVAMAAQVFLEFLTNAFLLGATTAIAIRAGRSK